MWQGIQGVRFKRLIMDESAKDRSPHPPEVPEIKRAVFCSGKVRPQPLSAPLLCDTSPNPSSAARRIVIKFQAKRSCSMAADLQHWPSHAQNARWGMQCAAYDWESQQGCRRPYVMSLGAPCKTGP